MGDRGEALGSEAGKLKWSQVMEHLEIHAEEFGFILVAKYSKLQTIKMV